MLKKKII